MLAPDVNVLVYAHREDTREHAEHAEWLSELANGVEPFIEHGCEWITNDIDFARFPGLRWRPPHQA